ncbi:MAG: SIS domain-containing protein [Candidatus Hodarchaeota archaeon]
MNLEKRASEILDTQQEAVKKLQVTPAMLNAILRISGMKESRGRIITTGIGKAGIIATKMSATLSSIGLPSFYVHPGESGHGDMGRVAAEDLLIVFSNSGNTSEVIGMISNVNDLNDGKNFVITVTGNENPKIPSDLVVCYGKLQESCVVSKVPSTSTTIMLVIADILAITAAESLGLEDSWFKARHPGGAIGKSYKEGN